MFAFLDEADNVEVESYFYTQKLAVQAAFEKIIGSGTDEERKVSKEEAVIGEFGRWAGRRPGASRDAGDSFDQDELRRYAQHYEPEMLMNNPELLNQIELFSFEGFGELGVYGTRPGGAVLGFYPQLKIAGALLDRADASSQEKILRSGGSEGADSMIMGAGTLATGGGLTTAMNTAMMNMAANMGPLTTMINQYNPLIFTANAIKNVEFATKFSTGKSDGYMWEAQMLAAVKQPIVASGQAAIIAGMGDPEPITKAILLGLGTVLIGLGNSIQVNTTTGERATKMTDAAAINTAITAIGSMLGGANQAAQGTADTMDAAAKLGETSQYMADSARAVANSMELGSQITNVMSTGFTSGIQYDAKGNYQGWSAAGKNGTVVAVDTAIAAFSTWAGSKIKPNTTGMSAFESAAAQGLVSDAISMPLSVLGEYYKHETLGAEYSNYTAMQNPGFERLGALVAIGWQAEFQGRINEQIQSQAYVEYQQQREASNRYNFRQILYGAAATAIRREENADGSVTETVHAERLVNLLDKIFKEQKQEVNRDDIRAMIVSLYGMDGYEPNQHIDFSKISQIFTTLGGSFYQDFNATTTGNILKGVQTEVNQYRRMKFNEAMDQLNSLDWPEAKKQAYALGLSQGDWSAWNEYTQAEEKAYNDALFVGMANSTLQQMESEKISAVRAVMQEVARAQLASYHGAIPMGQMSKSQREAVDEKFGAGTYDWYMSVMESAESHRKEFENQSEIDLFWRGVGNFGADTSHALAYLSNINPAAYVNIGLQKLIYNYRNTGKIDSGVLTRGPISPLDMIELVKRAREEELNTAMAGYMSELDPYESAHFMDGAQRQIDAGYMTAEVVTAVVTEIATLGTGKFINAATKLSMRGLKAAALGTRTGQLAWKTGYRARMAFRGGRSIAAETFKAGMNRMRQGVRNQLTRTRQALSNWRGGTNSGTGIFARGSKRGIGRFNHSADEVSDLIKHSNTDRVILEAINNKKITGPTLEVLLDAKGAVGGRMVPLNVGGQRAAHIKLQRLHNMQDNAVSAVQEIQHGMDYIKGILKPSKYGRSQLHRFVMEVRGHLRARQWALKNSDTLAGKLRFSEEMLEPMSKQSFITKIANQYDAHDLLRHRQRLQRILDYQIQELGIERSIFL